MAADPQDIVLAQVWPAPEVNELLLLLDEGEREAICAEVNGFAAELATRDVAFFGYVGLRVGRFEVVLRLCDREERVRVCSLRAATVDPREKSMAE